MSLALRITVIVLCVLFLLFVFRAVSKGRLLLKYSLLWILLAVLGIVVAAFPEPIFVLAALLGFETPSNFIFPVGIFFLLCLTLYLTITVSWQATYIKELTQKTALLEKEFANSTNIEQEASSEQ